MVTISHFPTSSVSSTKARKNAPLPLPLWSQRPPSSLDSPPGQVSLCNTEHSRLLLTYAAAGDHEPRTHGHGQALRGAGGAGGRRGRGARWAWVGEAGRGEARAWEAGMRTPRSGRLAQRCWWAVLLRSGAELITSFLISRPRSTCPGPSPPRLQFSHLPGSLEMYIWEDFCHPQGKGLCQEWATQSLKLGSPQCATGNACLSPCFPAPTSGAGIRVERGLVPRGWWFFIEKNRSLAAPRGPVSAHPTNSPSLPPGGHFDAMALT